MQIMNFQQYRMVETLQGTSPVTAPAFGMAKVKIPTEVAKKGIETGSTLLTAGAAALTGQVLTNKSQKLTVNEIVNDSLDVLGHELPEMEKEELKALDAKCDKTIAKCDEYLKSRKSSHVEMYKELLEDEGAEIKEAIASAVYMDIRDFYQNNIGDPDEPNDTREHINYRKSSKEELDNLGKQIDGFIEECDKYAYGNVKDEIQEYKAVLQDEKKAIDYLPKIDKMSFEELYALYDGSAGVLGNAVFHRLLGDFYSQFDEKNKEIEKMCANYERGCANYLRSSGNQKLLIAQEMVSTYGPHCLDDIE